MTQLISLEDFTSVQEVQAGTTRLFAKAAKRGRFYRVMRNRQSLGVMIPDNFWKSLLEDWEAMNSPKYLTDIAKSRQAKKFYSAAEIEKELGID